MRTITCAFVGIATLLLLSFSIADKYEDEVVNLPGLTFDYLHRQFSGYLTVPSGNKLHYWFLEAQKEPEKAPLVLWLNGGPGCSSLVGLFTELGPFYPNPDGETLFENVYSWNKVSQHCYSNNYIKYEGWYYLFVF